MAKFKVTIDREECTSCAQCWEICPEFFEQNGDDEFSQVVEEHRTGGNPAEGEAPEELADSVKEAAEACPVEIIHLEETG